MTERLLRFVMMRWAYQTPIKRATNYHAHAFLFGILVKNALSDKIISHNLRHLREKRQLAVEWMKTLLKDVPGDRQNFVLMDSTHQLNVSEILPVNLPDYNPNFDFEKQIRLMYIF